METGTGAILLVIGVVALFAAIVGGGVKIKEIEVGNLPSRWRQGALAIFGMVVGITGLIMVSGVLDSSNGNAAEPAQNVENADEGIDSAAEEATAGSNASDENTADENNPDTATDSNSSEEPAQQ
jgi:hypothetical protein